MTDATVEQDLYAVAVGLPIGDVARVTCPECYEREGGHLTRIAQTRAFFTCYRASCGHRQTVWLTGATPAPLKAAHRTSKGGRYEGPLVRLNADDAYIQRLAERYHILPERLARSISGTESDWYAITVEDHRGITQGHVLRYDWLAPKEKRPVPKSKTYIETGYPPLAWFGRDHNFHSAMLVEDCLSAIRLADIMSQYFNGINAVALLGTELSNAKVVQLQQAGISDIAIALDADATDLAFKIAARWSPAFSSFRVIVLDEDIKDMSPQKFAERFE